MKQRIQFLADTDAKDRYERKAWSEGRSLSGWLRNVADAAAREEPERLELASRADLDNFFRRSNEFVDARRLPRVLT